MPKMIDQARAREDRVQRDDDIAQEGRAGSQEDRSGADRA